MSAAPPTEDVEATAAWLRFLARARENNPWRMISLIEAEAVALEDLVKGVTVRDDDILTDGVTF